MSKETFTQATAYLKQAVPLMIKYQIPTTPTNYALWYTYVAQTDPQLNAAVDQTLQTEGTCSPLSSELLYQQHVAAQTERNVENMKQSLEAMVSELGASMHDTLSDTGDFQTMLDKSFGRLQKFDDEGMSIEETISLVRELVQGASNISQSTRQFHTRLTDAEKEISDLRGQLEKSRSEAYHDALTGLMNRRAFDQELHHLLQLGSFSLIILDIDRFKSINDEFGHIFGDQVLKAIARRVRDGCKNGEKSFRIGGEEIALLLPGRNLAVARQVAEALRRAIEKVTVMDRKNGRRLNTITASFGVAEFAPGDSYEMLMRRADEQLYKAKELGRNRVMPMSL
ncbi:GGDEF domain-containing protein [Pseudaeromonas sharmana]|uniref:diguanylate cyclase n=1 Tax=Pseudaeromonas sharmana TaxID=328412 RepID=A0ABV8CKP9_9GAMM